MERYPPIQPDEHLLRLLTSNEAQVERMNCNNDGLATFSVFVQGTVSCDTLDGLCLLSEARLAAALRQLQARHALLRARVGLTEPAEPARLAFVEPARPADIPVDVVACDSAPAMAAHIHQQVCRTAAQRATWEPARLLHCQVLHCARASRIAVGFVASHAGFDALCAEQLLHELLQLLADPAAASSPPVPLSFATSGPGPLRAGMLPSVLAARVKAALAGSEDIAALELVERQLLELREYDEHGKLQALPSELCQVQALLEANARRSEHACGVTLDTIVLNAGFEARKLLVDTHAQYACLPAELMHDVRKYAQRSGTTIHALLGAAFHVALAGRSGNRDTHAFTVATPVNLRRPTFGLDVREPVLASQPLFTAVEVSSHSELLSVARRYAARCAEYVEHDRHLTAWFSTPYPDTWAGGANGAFLATFSNLGRARLQPRYAGLPVSWDRVDIPLALHGSIPITVELVTLAGCCHVTLSHEWPSVSDESAQLFLARMTEVLQDATRPAAASA